MGTTVKSIKDLTDELEKQLKRLTLIHTEIGYEENLKHEKRIELFSSVGSFIVDQVDKAELEKERIIQDTQSAHNSIVSFKRLMGEFAPNKIVFDESKSLKSNLADLQKQVKEVEERYNTRLVNVKELYVQLEDFKVSLGDFVNTSRLMTTEIDVSSLAVNALEEEIQRCEIEYVNRKESVEDGVKQICNMMVVLGIKPENEQDILIDRYYHETLPNNKMALCNQLVSDTSLRYIATRISQLDQQKQEVEFRKEEITQSLKHLWRRLHVEPQQCEIFLMSNRGLTKQELEHYEAELSRLLVLKQERVGDFIQTAREELTALWDQLYYSDSQRRQFQPAFTKEYSDTILEAHENEVSRLQLETEDSKNILELIEKHMKLKKEIEEFEATTRDPNRLFGKGQRDPGRLLREEKFRKRIARELPKVTKELEGFLLEYEAMKGHPFLVYGKSYFDVIYQENNSQENQKPQQTENEKPMVAPKTPNRGIEPRKPVTSPRAVRTVRHMFNTPQSHRVKSLHLTTMESPKIDNSVSVLHRVRENNIKKHKQQKVIKRGHIFDDDDDEESEEDTTDSIPLVKQHPRKRLAVSRTQQSDSDDNLDLGIFDDGPDLSDMSEIDA